MTIFSSRGPNPSAGDIIKPDITAPGLQILAGDSPFGDLPPISGATPDGELFQAIAGTSMSSPHMAGFYALLRQAHPDWSAAMAKSAVMTTADPDVADNDRSSEATPFGQGSGLLDPGKVKDKGSAFNPGLVYDAGFNDYLDFLCGNGRRSSSIRRRRARASRPPGSRRPERPQLPVDRRCRSRRHADGHTHDHQRRRQDA